MKDVQRKILERYIVLKLALPENQRAPETMLWIVYAIKIVSVTSHAFQHPRGVGGLGADPPWLRGPDRMPFGADQGPLFFFLEMGKGGETGHCF